MVEIKKAFSQNSLVYLIKVVAKYNLLIRSFKFYQLVFINWMFDGLENYYVSGFIILFPTKCIMSAVNCISVNAQLKDIYHGHFPFYMCWGLSIHILSTIY